MFQVGTRWLGVLLAVVVLSACERAKSSNPLSPSIAGPIAGVEIDVPKPLVPAAASKIPVEQQPITLMVENAESNGVRPVHYIFEIGTDASFATKVFSQTGIEPGDGGRTSLKLPQSLAPERGYYWRAKADDGANASDYSSAVSFEVYTPVVIQAPVLRQPEDGTTVTTRKPTMVAANAQRTGPAGAMRYLFEVATDAAIANKVISVLVNEGAGETSYTAPEDLSYGTRYYWRVKALDPGHESTYSAIRSFVTPAAPVVVTPPGPGPSPGPSPGPGGLAQDDINMSAATIHNSPYDLAQWPATSKITGIEMRSSGVHVEFSKSDGPGRWPDVYPPGWDEPLQYTLGMCMNISGKWHCSAPIQFWYGLYESGGPPNQYAHNWFYDAGRWGPMAGHQPAVGEMIGIFVCGGNCRNNTTGSNSTVKERTNVVLVPMPSNSGASFRF